MHRKSYTHALLLFMALALFASCASIPKNATPVTGFQTQKYLGTWYEIARTDNRFERGLDNVTANYSLKEDGHIRVANSGYSNDKKQWKWAIGKAKFRHEATTAALKVSFFGPFYAGYNVVALDKDYRYAMVAGKDLSYLWILSREKTIPADVKESYLALAKQIGYDTDALLWVRHDKTNPGEESRK